MSGGAESGADRGCLEGRACGGVLRALAGPSTGQCLDPAGPRGVQATAFSRSASSHRSPVISRSRLPTQIRAPHPGPGAAFQVGAPCPPIPCSQWPKHGSHVPVHARQAPSSSCTPFSPLALPSGPPGGHTQSACPLSPRGLPQSPTSTPPLPRPQLPRTSGGGGLPSRPSSPPGHTLPCTPFITVDLYHMPSTDACLLARPQLCEVSPPLCPGPCPLSPALTHAERVSVHPHSGPTAEVPGPSHCMMSK